MKKQLKRIIISTFVIVIFLTSFAYAADITKTIKAVINGYTFNINSKTITVNSIKYNGVVYVPVTSIAPQVGYNISLKGNQYILSPKVSIDALQKENQQLKSKIADLEAQLKTSEHPDPVAQGLPQSLTIKNVTIKLNRVVQDSDSIKIYVTYINNSDNQAMTGDSLAKVVSNGKQYEYDSDFAFERYYNKNVAHASDFIEPTVSSDSVIFLKPISEVNKVNIVLNANFEEYRFNDIKVELVN